MKFNLFGLFRQKNATEDVAKPSPAPEPPIAQFQTDFGKAILSMTDEQARASWERREANEKYSQRRYMIGVALCEAYPDINDKQKSILKREFAEILPDEDATRVIISRIKSKQQSPEQILEELKKNMTVGNVVGGNSPAPNEEKTGKQWPPPMMPQEQWDKYWPELEANERWSQRRYMIGVALYEAYPDMGDSQSSILEREFADILPDENATRAAILKIKEKKQSPEQILEELKKNMNVGPSVVRGNGPAP